MNKNALAALLDDLRTLILRSRPAYCDYLGKKVKTPEETIASFLVPSGEFEIEAGSSEFAGFAIGETYVLRIGDKKFTIAAEDSGTAEGPGLLYHANLSDSSVEDDGFILFGGGGAFVGLFGSIYTGGQLTLSSAEVLADSWDVKKLPYKLLPDQLLSDLEEMMEKLRSQIKSLRVDPVFTGSFSQNRMPGTDIGTASHAEGRNTTASGAESHAEGFSTVASADYQHVEGIYNIDDGANGDKLHIVGNGTSLKRSNAHTLDKSGNAWYAGDVYVGSTSGTNRDAGSKKLATKEYVDDTKLIVASSSGKKYKITVDDTGTLSATEVTDTTT